MEQFEGKTQDVRNDSLLTLEETADILAVPVKTIRSWAHTGALPSLSIGRSLEKRFRMCDVIAFMMK